MDFSKVKTIDNDEDYLRQESNDVLKNDKKLDDDIKFLSDFCKENDVFAMASVQLGIPKKIIYIKSTDENTAYNPKDKHDEEIIMINPRIIEEKGETYFWEACASCNNLMGKVKRPYSIKIKYQDLDFNYHEEVMEGFKATVFSHEYDHLFGILHIDIAEVIYDMSLDERRKFREKKENKYIVISKTKKYKHSLR